MAENLCVKSTQTSVSTACLPQHNLKICVNLMWGFRTSLIRIPKVTYELLRCKHHHRIPTTDVLNFFRETFGFQDNYITSIVTKYHRLNLFDYEHMKEVLDALSLFNITREDAGKNPSLFMSHAVMVKNHGRILLECGFEQINAENLVKYNYLVKNQPVCYLKRNNLIRDNLNVYMKLFNCFTDIPEDVKTDYVNRIDYIDEKTLDFLRLETMQNYLEWRFNIKKELFRKMLTYYHQFRHRPLHDIEDSISIAINDIKMPIDRIISYPYVMSANPENTRKILNEIRVFNGIDARTVINIRPGIIRANYKSIIKIRRIIDKYNIPAIVEKRAYIIYTLKPETIEKRLEELVNNKYFQVFASHPSALLMVLYKNKVITRLDYIRLRLNKKCPQMNQLLQSKKEFETKVHKLGDVNCGGDVCHVVINLLYPKLKNNEDEYDRQLKVIWKLLKRNNNWLSVPLYSITETTTFLMNNFSVDDLLDNLPLVLYPLNIVSDFVSSVRSTNFYPGKDIPLNNKQILSMVSYMIEKEYSFTGDGIWMEKSDQSEFSAIND